MKSNFFKKNKVYFFILIPIFIISFFLLNNDLNANSEVDALNQKIEDKKSELQKIEQEIKEQQQKLQQTTGQKTTLQNKVNELEASRKKIQTEIKETQNQIEKTELTIQKLNIEITEKEKLIEKNSEAVAESIRRMNEYENISLIERFLNYDSLSELWNDFEQTLRIQNQFRNEINNLISVSEELKENENQKRTEKDELSKFQIELSGEHEAVASIKTEQEKLLAQTKNQEASYQKLLQEKIAQKKAFEDEILKIESDIKKIIDPDSYPRIGNGVLSWPINPPIKITQQFGGTQFAKTNPGVYSRPFHPGVDFGIPVGTKIYSTNPGTVRSTGNTDAYSGCYAWGKWILVDHDNGLSTLYAHLSSIMVSPGQRVDSGTVIALSGNTGISTGPHLHFTLYATQGVDVRDYNNPGSGCTASGAYGPFADLDAYLDPMQYLPVCSSGVCAYYD